MVLLGPEENRYWCLEPPEDARGAPAKAGARLAKGLALRKEAFEPFAASPWGLVPPVGNHARSASVTPGRLARARDDRIPTSFCPSVDGRRAAITGTLHTSADFIVHSLQEVNDGLAHGRYFLIDVARDGIVFYQSHAPLSPAQGPNDYARTGPGLVGLKLIVRPFAGELQRQPSQRENGSFFQYLPCISSRKQAITALAINGS